MIITQTHRYSTIMSLHSLMFPFTSIESCAYENNRSLWIRFSLFHKYLGLVQECKIERINSFIEIGFRGVRFKMDVFAKTGERETISNRKVEEENIHVLSMSSERDGGVSNEIKIAVLTQCT